MLPFNDPRSTCGYAHPVVFDCIFLLRVDFTECELAGAYAVRAVEKSPDLQVAESVYLQDRFLRVTQGDVFTNNAIGLAVELPATLAAIWLLDCLGRKKTTLALFLILGGSVPWPRALR